MNRCTLVNGILIDICTLEKLLLSDCEYYKQEEWKIRDFYEEIIFCAVNSYLCRLNCYDPIEIESDDPNDVKLRKKIVTHCLNSLKKLNIFIYLLSPIHCENIKLNKENISIINQFKRQLKSRKIFEKDIKNSFLLIGNTINAISDELAIFGIEEVRKNDYGAIKGFENVERKIYMYSY